MRVINVQFDFVNGTLYLYVVHSLILVSYTHLAFSMIPMSANTHSESCLSLLYQSPGNDNLLYLVYVICVVSM